MGGYGEMTSMIGMERAGQPSGPSFLPSRCFGTTPDMLTGYAPTQPPPHVSIYCDRTSGASDCLERLDSKRTCYVSSGT